MKRKGNVICNYCNKQTKLVKGNTIYPHRPDLSKKHFYLCVPCDAYVGCHDGTNHPLGRVANKELRKAKNAAHKAFDPMWRNGNMKRTDAYLWLANQLNIQPNKYHIGMFDVDMCKMVVYICERMINETENNFRN